jgi:hypothetical protein
MNIGAITCVLVIVTAPAFAQGSRSSLTVAHEYVAAESVPDEVAIPDNLQFDAAYRPLLMSMLGRSPTFRRQCLRLASDLRLTVHLHPSGSSWTRGARAVTRITRKPGAGGLDADIYLAQFDDEVELIAHELEHVIEQLDQIDLSSQAALPDTGVHRTLPDGTLFETTRARQVGLRVAREVRAAGPKAE